MIPPEVLVSAVSATGALLVSCVTGVFTLLNTRSTLKTEKEVETVREQVANRHSTNLREDIDEIKDAIGAIQYRINVRFAHDDLEHDRLWGAIKKKGN